MWMRETLGEGRKKLRPNLQLKWFSVNCGYANCHLLRLLSTQKNTITFFSLLFFSVPSSQTVHCLMFLKWSLTFIFILFRLSFSFNQTFMSFYFSIWLSIYSFNSLWFRHLNIQCWEPKNGRNDSIPFWSSEQFF